MSNIIILVIASRGDIYDKFITEYWIPMIKYAKNNYINIHIFLIFGQDTNINDFTEIKDNIIIAPYSETYRNILEKTLYTFDYCLQKYKFNFLFRTNLSSFILLDKLNILVNNLLDIDYIGGFIGTYNLDKKDKKNNFKFICGAGILFSKDIVQNLVSNRHKIKNEVVDDVDIGKYLYTNKFYYNNLPRYDLYKYKELLTPKQLEICLKTILDNNHYHVRIKNYNRLCDIQIISFLVNHFYK